MRLPPFRIRSELLFVWDGDPRCHLRSKRSQGPEGHLALAAQERFRARRARSRALLASFLPAYTFS